MQSKIYYIPSYNRLVYCHQHNESTLLLSGLCKFVSDAKTTVLRQEITVLAFAALQPVLVNDKIPMQYKFLYKNNIANTNSWCIVAENDTDNTKTKQPDYFKNAIILPNKTK